MAYCCLKTWETAESTKNFDEFHRILNESSDEEIDKCVDEKIIRSLGKNIFVRKRLKLKI